MKNNSNREARSSRTGRNTADLVLGNGRLFTMNPVAPWAEAVAVQGKRIVYVGDDHGVKEFIGPTTEIVDLQGRLVLPAFVDAHMHPASGAYRYASCLALFDVHAENQIQAYLDAAVKFIQTHPELTWIQGAGYRRSAFDALGPKKEWLDQVESELPVTIVSKDGHSMWVNSKALAMAGIDARTPDPQNGVIQRDPLTGEPSGLLQEAAMTLMTPFIPKPTREEVKKSLLWLQEWLNRLGITTAHDAILELDAPNVYKAYQELAEEGRLTVRYRASWRIDPDRDFLADIDRALALSERFNTPYFQARTFKFFADEVIEEETAYLLEPYVHRSDQWFGLKDWEDEALKTAFTRIHQAGGQVHVHAIGDGAARYVLNALEAVERETGLRDRRPLLAHLQIVAPEDVRKMAALGATAIISPYWATIDDYFWDMYVDYLGRERAFYGQYPLKSFFDAGVNTAVHSDFSVTEPDMSRAIYCALTRRSPRRIFEAMFSRKPGYHYAPEGKLDLEYGDIGALPPDSERIGLDEILRASTYNGAYANFLENDLGSLEPGKLADLAVFDRNLFEIDVEEISDARVVMTLFEGRPVHRVGLDG